MQQGAYLIFQQERKLEKEVGEKDRVVWLPHWGKSGSMSVGSTKIYESLDLCGQ